MARMRTLKPGFFINESLCGLEPLTRILFQGLWALADREGRLEDRPRMIKIQILPFDDANVDTMLDDLAAAGFILRYKAGQSAYIQVVNFLKHQCPNAREVKSIIPAPLETDWHSESTVKAQCEHSTGENPDFQPSQSCTPLSGTEQLQEQVQEQEQSHASAHEDAKAYQAAATAAATSPAPQKSGKYEYGVYLSFLQAKNHSGKSSAQLASLAGKLQRTGEDDEPVKAWLELEKTATTASPPARIYPRGEIPPPAARVTAPQGAYFAPDFDSLPDWVRQNNHREKDQAQALAGWNAAYIRRETNGRTTN